MARRSARSPVYSVPYIGSRTMAKHVLLRNGEGRTDEALMGAGLESCSDLERMAVEIQRERGVPQTEKNITIVEVPA